MSQQQLDASGAGGNSMWECQGSVLPRLEFPEFSSVLAELTLPSVPEFNQTRALGVSTAENFHVTILARQRRIFQ